MSPRKTSRIWRAPGQVKEQAARVVRAAHLFVAPRRWFPAPPMRCATTTRPIGVPQDTSRGTYRAPAELPPTSDPVCGCNGIAYNNDCERQMARAQLDHTGACTGGGGAGGGSGGQGGGAGGGTGACGGTDCASGKVCVHAQCLNCTPAPAPFCADVPAACSGTPTCCCLPFAICQRNGQAGGTCISVDSSGVHCG